MAEQQVPTKWCVFRATGLRYASKAVFRNKGDLRHPKSGHHLPTFQNYMCTVDFYLKPCHFAWVFLYWPPILWKFFATLPCLYLCKKDGLTPWVWILKPFKVDTNRKKFWHQTSDNLDTLRTGTGRGREESQKRKAEERRRWWLQRVKKQPH